VLVMLGNVLVILGAESRHACAVAIDGMDGTFSDRPAWKRHLAITLDHLLEAVYRVPIDDPRFDDELAQCTQSGVNAIRFEMLNEAFALVSLALLVLGHVAFILWLSHRVESNSQWLQSSPPLNMWRPSRLDPSHADFTPEHHGKHHGGCGEGGLSSTGTGTGTGGGGGGHQVAACGTEPMVKPVRGFATASELVSRPSRAIQRIQRSSSRQPSPPSPSKRSSSQQTSSRRLRRFSSGGPANCSSSSLAREHTSNSLGPARSMTGQRSAWSQLLSLAASPPQVASNSRPGDEPQQGGPTLWHTPVHRVLQSGCASRVHPIDAGSSTAASVGAVSDPHELP